ncbi:S-layer homology domain-containing protein [Bacillus ndiopicus]|uniref:S-layer homology domain-containing protein n=1 Tax=Bacillus ndiopicus TaxID=1347368 RepID=UPI0005A7C87B|nr:S-layer homology domain-containing protein [Bacillus ndiopicus]
MALWKKQLHIALVFILVLSLFSPASVINAQHFEGEIVELNTEDSNDINDSNLDDSTEQNQTTEMKLEDSEKWDNVLKPDNDADLEHLTQLDDVTGTMVTPFMAPFAISDIQFNAEEPLLILEGQGFQLTATTDDSATVIWTSSKPEFATVSVDGFVTALSMGELEITARTDTLSKKIKVCVITPEQQHVIQLIEALLPVDITSADGVTEILLTEARQAFLDLPAKPNQKTIINNLGYNNKLADKEAQWTRFFIESLPPVTTIDDAVAQHLIKARAKYASLIQDSKNKLKADGTEAYLTTIEQVYFELLISIIEPLNIRKNTDELLPLLSTARTIANGEVTVNNRPTKFGKENYETLVSKEVDYVIYLIDLLPEIIQVNDEATKAQIAAARAAYNKLDKNVRDGKTDIVVTNYQDLVDKENILSAGPRIQAVIDKINAFPSIELITWWEHYAKVIEVQQAYDKLSVTEQKQVSNYSKLEALQKRLMEIQPTTVQAYESVVKYYTSSSYEPTYGSEWTILTLARGDHSAKHASFYEKYYRNLANHVKTTNGNIDTQATDWARVIIALTAIGKDPTDVAGYNLVEKLEDISFATSPGINSTIYSLIALDTWKFELSEAATTTREKLIDAIVKAEKSDGGFAFSGSVADADMTGMALQALAPYQSNTKVKAVTERAIAKLVDIQLANGGYKSGDSPISKGSENPESAAQVITALASLGIDANQDNRFDKVIANIMTYSSSDGGFKHVLSQTKADGMATVQVGYTLAAYNRLLSGQTALYDMSDTKDNPSKPGDKDGSEKEEPSPPDNGGSQPSNPPEKEEIGYTTVSIRISSSEVPLRPTATKLFAGETAFDVLKRATDENGIALSYRQTEYGIYVDGIAGLYEFDRGPLSGWMYRVNGIYPSYSAANYVLSPKDSVEWLFTTDLGKDIGGHIDEVDSEDAEEQNECTKDCIKVEKKCTDEIEQCNEEINKDSSITEIMVDENGNKAVITFENIQEYLKKNIQTIIVQNKNNIKLEIPISALAGIQLANDEHVVVSITKQLENNQFTVNFAIESYNGRLKHLSTRQNYLKVTLPAHDVKRNAIVLQLVDGEYKSVPHKIINGEIIIYTKTSGIFVVTENTVTFKDIAHLANKEEIEFLASRLIIHGTTPETFEPNKPITRAQFAALISRSLGLQATGENPFSDTTDKWYESDIQALFEAGITKGTTTTTFNPEEPITRQQAAAFMARILEYLNVDGKSNGKINFNDTKNISTEYLPYIELLNSLDIMTGKPDGSFDPGAPLTRGQTAKILKRTLQFANIL